MRLFRESRTSEDAEANCRGLKAIGPKPIVAPKEWCTRTDPNTPLYWMIMTVPTSNHQDDAKLHAALVLWLAVQLRQDLITWRRALGIMYTVTVSICTYLHNDIHKRMCLHTYKYY